jgi:hypothetical protein
LVYIDENFHYKWKSVEAEAAMFVDARGMLAGGSSPRMATGLAVVDVDRAGPPALFVAGFRCPNRLLRWQDGRLVDAGQPGLADATGPSTAVAAADLDRDGREEIYVVNCDVRGGAKTTADRLFRYDGTMWRDLFDIPANERSRNRLAARAVAALDRRGAGRYGFVLATHGGPIRLYEQDLTQQLHDVAAIAQLDEPTGGSALLVAPLLSPTPDVLAANLIGPSFLFRPLGNGAYADWAGEAAIDGHGGAVAAAVLDANGDGRLDLAMVCQGAPHRLWIQTADGRFADAAPSAFADWSTAAGIVVADFDNDGYEELFVHNAEQPNRLYGWREGGWRPIDCGAALEPHRSAGSAVVADLDGDGVVELVLSHGPSEQPLSIFRPDAPRANHWLRVVPRTAMGAPARGAQVTVEAGDRTQTRVIDAGGASGGGQSEPVAHFGLGLIDRVDRVMVRWPDGTEVDVTRVDARQVLEVQHPARVRDAATRRVR